MQLGFFYKVVQLVCNNNVWGTLKVFQLIGEIKKYTQRNSTSDI